MNRTIALATLALTLLGGLALQAAQKPQPPGQSAPAVLESAPEGTVVFDDDGGRAQIIPRRAVPDREATFHGGPVVSHAQVQAIFLGSGWRDRANRAKESVALDGLRHQAKAGDSLAMYGVGAWELEALAVEDLAGDPLAGDRISDLEIQTRLDDLLSGADSIDAVYVVFLAPGLGATLGNKSAEEIAAYHNHLHTESGTVHYAVVPFDRDSSRWLTAAGQSLREVLINPEGTAWY
jgi:hypothetical protein